MARTLRIGSRASALALAQAHLVKRQLEAALAGLVAEIVEVSTSGDRMKTASLAQVGGKGLFIKELEQALTDGRADIAVHSMKDLPAVLAPQYRIAAVPERENPCDAVVTRAAGGWSALGHGARVGTSSVRRRLQALWLRPDLEVKALRGNVDTRLKRLGAGEFDAIILAMAGLKRLDRARGLNLSQLDENEFVPCGGQGALAIEAVADAPIGGSREIDGAISALDDPRAHAEIAAERAFLAAIGASCVSPVGVKGTFAQGRLKLSALLFSIDGQKRLDGSIEEDFSAPDTLAAAAAGVRLAERMLAEGAGEMIAGELAGRG